MDKRKRKLGLTRSKKQNSPWKSFDHCNEQIIPSPLDRDMPGTKMNTSHIKTVLDNELRRSKKKNKTMEILPEGYDELDPHFYKMNSSTRKKKEIADQVSFQENKSTVSLKDHIIPDINEIKDKHTETFLLQPRSASANVSYRVSKCVEYGMYEDGNDISRFNQRYIIGQGSVKQNRLSVDDSLKNMPRQNSCSQITSRPVTPTELSSNSNRGDTDKSLNKAKSQDNSPSGSKYTIYKDPVKKNHLEKLQRSKSIRKFELFGKKRNKESDTKPNGVPHSYVSEDTGELGNKGWLLERKIFKNKVFESIATVSLSFPKLDYKICLQFYGTQSWGKQKKHFQENTNK